MPLVSAIVTTFNRSVFMKKAVESILAQTFEDFELLILDNSSEDDTEVVVKSFEDARIRYIKHEPMNISKARNLGVEKARGEYIAFLDDDDEWLPCKLEEEVKVFKASSRSVALTYGGFVEIDSEGRELGIHLPKLSGRVLKNLITQEDAFTGSASNPMLKRSVINELGGYNEKVVTGEDAELYFRLAEKYDVAFTDNIVLRIRGHEGARLGDKLDEAAGLELMIMKNFNYIFDEDRKLKSFYFQKIGGKFIRIGATRKGRKYVMQAIKVNPFNRTAYLQYILSLTGLGLYNKFHSIYRVGSREKQMS